MRLALPASSAGVTRTTGPMPLRVSGRAAYALGKTMKAAVYFERAIAAALELGARYDLARAYLDASRVIPEKADEYRRRGQQLLDELGAVVPDAERIELQRDHETTLSPR